jgi:hypothetical protein
MARRQRWKQGALAALLLTAPATACDQPPTPLVQQPAREQPSREALAPNADVQALFERLRERPATDPSALERSPQQAAQLEPVISDIFRRGETVTGWQRQGVGFQRLLAAQPGGAEANMLVGTGPFGRYHVYPGDPAVSSLIPAEWDLVARYGERRNDGRIQVEVVRISPMLVKVERLGLELVGNATCRLHGQILIFADPAIPASRADLTVLGFDMRARQELDRFQVYSIAEEQVPGVYASRLFDRNGSRLSNAEANIGTFRIVPRAPFR